MHEHFGLKTCREDNLGDLVVVGRTVLKCMKGINETRTEFSSMKIGSSGWFL